MIPENDSLPNQPGSEQISAGEVLLHRMMNRIRQSLQLPEILSDTVTQVRLFLQTDRVMVYRFDSDGSGEVVAESVAQQRLPPLIGQHFPSEDIPPEARELFLRARQRSVVDVARQTIGVSPLNSDSDESTPTNDIRFRPIDGCHAEYLTTMGVLSSLVVPILHRHQLWGLLVSHHSQPRQVSERELQVVQLVSDELSIAIAQCTLVEQTRAQASQEATINRVAFQLHSMTEMHLQQALELTVSALGGAGGRIYIAPQTPREEALVYVCGQWGMGDRGEIEELPSWQEWLNTSGNGSEAWIFSDLQQVAIPEELDVIFASLKMRGLLVIKLQYRQHFLGYLSVFRRAVDVETIWARRPDANDPKNELPIISFEKWREIKKAQAQVWTDMEIELSRSLGNHFAMAIHQYQLYQQVKALNADLQRDIQERILAEEKISALNAKLEERVQQRTAQLQTANTSLQRLSRQHELILNSAGEGIYGLDRQGKITFINPAAAKMLGYAVKELTEQYMHVIVNHSQPNGTSYTWEQNPIHSTLETGGIQYISNDIFYRRDGSKFPIEYVSTPIREQGEIVGAVVIFKDITERQIIERMKDEFISIVSHELRTPLTSIRSALGLLARGSLKNDSQKSQRMLEIAFDNTNRLVRLINDILDIERINSGKATMHCIPCNAGDLMNQAVDEMRAMAEKAEINLHVTPLSVQLTVDADRIIQTLTNLLNNAIKFAPPGSTVWLSAEVDNGEQREVNHHPFPTILFKIKDQGRGIPQDMLETIFDRFQQVDGSNSRYSGGTGLGLAICRSIVQQHGGKIWAESTLGEGSTFYFTLPLGTGD
ncbi:MAG: ATP-binding protein [Nostocaceae cyanobacterium]|nr:ATP-binding protein [Nostocaceae cyanobacterium]